MLQRVLARLHHTRQLSAPDVARERADKQEAATLLVRERGRGAARGVQLLAAALICGHRLVRM